MDKRYFLMIIIIVLSMMNLYVVMTNSDVVGTASVSFGDYIFTSPHNFDLLTKNANYVQIFNSNFGYVSLSYANDNSYDSFLNSSSKNESITILSKGTINVENITVDSVYYSVKDNKGYQNNMSKFFFKKHGKMFQLSMNSFDYNNRNKTIEILTDIIESLRINYKTK